LREACETPVLLKMTKLIDVKLLTVADPEAGLIETGLRLNVWLAVSVLLMLSAWPYVKVALGYALRARLTQVALVPRVVMPVPSFPWTNTTGAVVIVTFGCMYIE
jgi:hypothetical protein